jgi:uncharacterized membrane protein YecN with MAPEG domain
MLWVQLVTVLAVLQFAAFGILVGAARVRHNVPAPAMSGHEAFDRYFRVHMNTLETLVFLLPAMWVSALYWAPHWSALLGAVYLVGRQIYLRSYVADPKKRSMGYSLSFLPAAVLSVVALYGIVRGLLQGSGAV